MHILTKLGLVAISFVLIAVGEIGAVDDRKNVLMIVIDDLRPELGEFTSTDKAMFKNIQTPNIDALAQESMKFTNVHAQYTTCAPSRASFLTGRRVDTSGIISKAYHFRDKMPNVVTLPQHFKNEGYSTYGIGKIFHTGDDDEANSWTEVIQPENEALWHKVEAGDKSWYEADTSARSKLLPDQEILRDAKVKIREMSGSSDKFFIAVGFKRPHLPLVCPKEYFDLYPESDIDLPKYPNVPKDYPDIAWNSWLDLTNYADIAGKDNSYGKMLTDQETKDLRRAYYACVSYVDDLVKDLLQQIDDYGFTDDTVVLLMSDHGFHLGEHAQWTKGTLLNLDTHVPMLLKVPGVTDSGQTSNAFVENIDVFATLVEAAGVTEVPQCPEVSQPNLCHEGMSAYRYLIDNRANSKDWALTQYSRDDSSGQTWMGYSIHDDDFHYVRWVKYDSGTIDWDTTNGEELYDHRKKLVFSVKIFGNIKKKIRFTNKSYDPYETENRAADSTYKKYKNKLYTKLQKSYTAAMPSDAF